jgi:hypothetical protein
LRAILAGKPEGTMHTLPRPLSWQEKRHVRALLLARARRILP